MIKRRFYKVEHGDRDDPSGSSSSSTDSEVEAGAPEESEDDVAEELREDPNHSSTSSGSSVDDEDTEAGKLILSESTLPGKLHRAIKDRDSKTEDKNDVIPADALAYILKCKSIFKCRICPRVVCLNEDSLKAHLKSKKHIRSEKLLNDGRLKSMLNSDGEMEDQETAAEMHARIVSLTQDNSGKKEQKQRFRKKKMEADSGFEDKRQAIKCASKKQRRK